MKLFDLTEKSKNTTTLYRGDAEEIAQFTVGKADPQAMVGRGIYLTSSYEVAKDYTIKGQTDVIYRSEPGDGNDARGFLQNEFIKFLGNDASKMAQDFYWAIMGEAQRFEQLFKQEIANSIGTGQDARQNPRYRELQLWLDSAKRYVEAFLWKAGTPILIAEMRAVYDERYKAFKDTLKNTRMMKSVLDELVIIPEDKLGHVSRFRVPNEYLDRVYRVDDPMPDWLLRWIMKYGSDQSGRDVATQKVDLRYTDPVRGETQAENFKDWIKKFKEYGMRFAWGDHQVGGQGDGPTLLDFMVGTHFGQSLQYQNDSAMWDDLIAFMQGRGYTGFHYNGGGRTGPSTWTGGSPLKHDAYALWDDNHNKGFRISSKQIGMNSTDPKLFRNFKFEHIMKSLLSQLSAEHRIGDLKLRKDVINVDQIEAAAREWIKSGELKTRLEQSRAST